MFCEEVFELLKLKEDEEKREAQIMFEKWVNNNIMRKEYKSWSAKIK